MRVLLACLLLALSGQSGLALFLTFEKWEELSLDTRASYAAGAFDALVMVLRSSGDNKKTSDFLDTCVADAKLNPHQLADNIKSFGLEQPKELRARSFAAVTINYLTKLCGTTPRE